MCTAAIPPAACIQTDRVPQSLYDPCTGTTDAQCAGDLRLQGDVASLNAEIQRLLSQLAAASAAAADSTGLLRDADLARSRMEEVCTTLKVFETGFPAMPW